MWWASPFQSLNFVWCSVPCGLLCSPVLLRRLLLTQCNAFQWGGTTLQNFPSPGGSRPSPNTWFLGPIRVYNTNGISISSAIFVWLTNVTNRHTHTDRLKLHLQKEATSLHSVRVMWLNNKVTLNGKIITPHQVHHRQHQHYVFSYEGQSKSFATSYLS